ncbi:MAG: hypothetical protein RL123_1249 [Pseudomonadota bacterium]
MAVISLSSIPSRFPALERVLPALLAQDIGDVAIELYLPRRYRRFPDHDGTLPRVPPGVEIVRVDEDLGPATKILHAVERHRSADTPILYCDDDVLYAPGWARGLIEAQRAHPFAAVAAAGMNLDALGLPLPPVAGPRAILQRRARDWRYLVARAVQIARHGGAARVPPERKAIRRLVRRTGRIDIAEGYGGVVVRPSFFDASFREIPPVLWAVDDVWISGNLARRGVPILAVADAAQLRFMAEHHAPDALHQVAIEGAARFEANRRCALWMQEHLGVWR